MLSVAQFIISLPLFFFLAFGLGFILNMLLKTTWLPGWIYVGIMLLSAVYVYSKKQEMLHAVDLIVLACGLLGAFVSGWTIRTLRQKGYRMF